MARFFKYKIAFLLAGLLTSVIGSGKTIVVSPGAKRPVSTAFDVAHDGDTVLIRKGIYKEGAMTLKKRLIIIGENYPVLDGEYKYEILLVEHDGVVVKGVTFRNSGNSSFNDVAALKIQNSKNVLVANCHFEDNFFAIHTMNSSYVTYLNNRISSSNKKGVPSANGIHCWKSSHLTIRNNTVTGHRDGVYLEFVTHSLIEDNRSIRNSRYGMHFMFSIDNIYRKNIFQANGAGVAVMYSKRVKVEQNQFLENWGGAVYGLLLKELDDCQITGNLFRQNSNAVFADGSNRIEISNNDFLNNGWALKLNASCTDPVVTKNNFIGNTFDMATNGNLRMKVLEQNYWDKYEGYDLDRNGIGDIPYYPVTFFSMITEYNPGTLMLFRSLFVKLMDKAESIFPQLTPKNIKDDQPVVKRIKKLNP